MSQRNGDRARFNKDQKRKRHHRQRMQAVRATWRRQGDEKRVAHVASLQMQDEGAPLRAGD